MWLSAFSMCHLSSKQRGICFEGSLIAQQIKNQEYCGYLVLECWLKGWVPKQMGVIYTSWFTSPVFQLEKGKETCGWCCTHPSLKCKVLAGFQVHLYFCSRGSLLQGIPVTLHVSGLRTPWVEHLFCFLALDCGHCLCKLLMFPVILIFPAALCLLQCLAYCSEQWLKQSGAIQLS